MSLMAPCRLQCYCIGSKNMASTGTMKMHVYVCVCACVCAYAYTCKLSNQSVATCVASCIYYIHIVATEMVT